MVIVWDEPKRLANLAKHGLDFADLSDAFDVSTARVIGSRATPTGRVRHTLIGRWKGELVVVAIISPLGSEALALVSLRPASQTERAIYDET